MHRLAPFLILAIAACGPMQGPMHGAMRTPPLPASAAAAPARAARAEPIASLVRVRKAARTLEVWSGNQQLLMLTGVQLGREPVGTKQFEGDGRTPEGRYLVDWRNPHSAYHLSLHISYPNGQQVVRAQAQGRSAGGMVMIHGQPNGHEGRMAGDWTDGCIALSDAEIETLWDIVPDGAIVEILP